MKKNVWLIGMLLASLVIISAGYFAYPNDKGNDHRRTIRKCNWQCQRSSLKAIASKADITDSSGSFKLKNVPIGRQTLRVSLIGYEEAVIRNIEVTSSKEVVLEIRMKERIKKLEEVVVRAGRQKNRALNEAALVSARQFSVDEAVRYAGTRNDPSRMAQNYAGVSGTNDGRNDIIIRGNSPAGVLWRMEGIDIPNPNHYSTLGSTGGPVTILNTNTLKEF